MFRVVCLLPATFLCAPVMVSFTLHRVYGDNLGRMLIVIVSNDY